MSEKRLQAIPLKNIKIEDEFWARYISLVSSQIIPYQWDILNDQVEDCETSHCLMNFKIAGGSEKGNFYGAVFQDTDVAKWLEAVAYSLEIKPDEELEKKADEVIEIIAKAQGEEGYINTYFTIVEPENRWKNLQEGHELYTAGHLLEAAVAYYYATGKDRFLLMMKKFADYICDVFTQELVDAYPGHQEVEIGLIKLYGVTREEKYLKMARSFIERRGKTPNYFEQERENLDHYIFPEFKDLDKSYSQSHTPVRSQKTAEGHAVRAVYMYMAMADLAYEYGDEELMETCERLWENIVRKRMYLTGGIGSSGFGERFTCDYDLPNDSNYSETCASIGLALFGLRMAQIKKDAQYIEVVERSLYNTLLSGVALDGKSFFYVNPLEVWPDNCMDYTSKRHIKTIRQKWFGVACCPPNIARTLASLGQYIYGYSEKELYINLFISNKVSCEINKSQVELQVKTRFPINSSVQVKVKATNNAFTLNIRIPEYAYNPRISMDGKIVDYEMGNGYAKIERIWNEETVINFEFDMKAQLIRANPKVRADIGRVAIVKGPIVYCLEQIDNGDNLAAIGINGRTELQEVYDENQLGGVLAIKAKATKINDNGWEDKLYAIKPILRDEIVITAIPYCLWNNRGEGEMLVWIREDY